MQNFIEFELTITEPCSVLYSLNILTQLVMQADSQGLHLRYPRYGEDPDTGWSRGTQTLGARQLYLAGVRKNELSQIIVKQQGIPRKREVI